MWLSKLLNRSSFLSCAFDRSVRLASTSVITKISDKKLVLVDEVGDKGIITLNRPEALNAFDKDMAHEIAVNINKWQKTKSMILIKGAGEKAFCAGGDVRSIVESYGPDVTKIFFKTGYTTNYMIGSLKIPYVAFMNGITMGGGAGLSVHGKFRIGTEKTVFAMPETSIGHFPDVGCSYFLPRLPNRLGYYLGLTGSRLKGPDVWHAGIATHYCDSTKVPEIEKALLSVKSANEVEDVLKRYCIKPISEFSLSKQVDLINKAFNAQTVEEVLSNLEKDNSEFAKETIKTLRTLSPLSLKITLLELNVGSQLPLDQCLQMEYRIALNHFESNDFQEGVKAMLISKNKKPKWDPARIEDVSDEKVQVYFRKTANKDHLDI